MSSVRISCRVSFNVCLIKSSYTVLTLCIVHTFISGAHYFGQKTKHQKQSQNLLDVYMFYHGIPMRWAEDSLNFKVGVQMAQRIQNQFLSFIIGFVEVLCMIICMLCGLLHCVCKDGTICINCRTDNGKCGPRLL